MTPEYNTDLCFDPGNIGVNYAHIGRMSGGKYRVTARYGDDLHVQLYTCEREPLSRWLSFSDFSLSLYERQSELRQLEESLPDLLHQDGPILHWLKTYSPFRKTATDND